jgi:hypothetical protein
VNQRSGRKKELDSYIEDVRDRQRNTVFPDTLRGARSVDELLFKGVPHAPLVQRIGVMVIALFYVIIGVAFVLMALEKRDWFLSGFAVVIFSVAGWFIRNAFRK